MKSNLLVVFAVQCICVLQIMASTSTVCDEPNTEVKCSNECVDKCPEYPRKDCTKECVEGCFCKSDYSRASNGTCIPTENCPVTCPEDQVFTQKCTDSCIADRIRCSHDSFTWSCYCKPGLRRIDGRCVSIANCYNCTENEVYSESKNPCLETCPPVNISPEDCANLFNRGCTCKPNFKRHPGIFGKCIPVEQCPKTPKTT